MPKATPDPFDGIDSHRPMPLKPKKRGFASMSPERRSEISSKGGKAAHAKGTGHEWNSEEARAAGRKGGAVSRVKRLPMREPAADDLAAKIPGSL